MVAAFPGEQSSVDQLRSIRWKNGAFRPHCGQRLSIKVGAANGLEGAWSLFGPQLSGAHHRVSAKRLDRRRNKFAKALIA